MPRHRLRVTPAEWIVLAAIAAVMASAVLPAMQRGRQGPVVRRARTARDRVAPPSAGQSNTIRLPDAASGSPAAEQPARRRGPSGGGAPQWGLVPLLLIVVAVIVRLLRRSAGRQHRRRGPHEGA